MLMLEFLLLLLLSFLSSSSARPAPYGMRISCGSLQDVLTPAHKARWYKDFGYTGGVATNGTQPSFITPPLETVRYFPLSEGPENCYNITGVPNGHYSVRIFFGLVNDPNFDNEPLFDVSIEGTQIYTLKSGWSNHVDDQAFVEALLFFKDGAASLCFHSTGHGDPTVLSIEILQVDDKAYYFGPQFVQGTILRTVKRISCGAEKAQFDADYNGSVWGGDRFWNRIDTFNSASERRMSSREIVKEASVSPNFYPEALYQTALLSTNVQPNLTFALDVEPNREYSIWLHFAEIDYAVNGEKQRIFDILVNGDTVFKDVDIVERSGDVDTALVLNKTVAVNGRSLIIILQPRKGQYTIVSAIEVFEVIIAENNTLPSEVAALRILKNVLGLPLHLGWNGDPCVPQQHPWSGVDCFYDGNSSKWVIYGLGLDNQGLRGLLPDEISQLHHLQSINLSGNSMHGVLSPYLGNLTNLEILDLSYNSFNGSIPESLGHLTALRRLFLNSNSLSGRVPPALVGWLLHGASFNFTDNAGLCGIPGLRTCGPHLSSGAKIGIALGAFLGLLMSIICLACWWKRRQNILRTQKIAARDAPYAKARTHFSRDVQMTIHHNHDHKWTAAENGHGP